MSQQTISQPLISHATESHSTGSQEETLDRISRGAFVRVVAVDGGDAIARRVDSLLPKNLLPKACPPAHQTAFTTAPQVSPAQARSFAAYGFMQTIALKGAPT